MVKKLTKLISSEKSEILSAWVKQIKALGGSYVQVNNAELLNLCQEFLDAFMEIIEKGNFLRLRIYIDKYTQLRSSQGFRLSEILRAYYSFYGVIKPIIVKSGDKTEAIHETLDNLNSILVDTLFELSEAYHKRLNERIDNYINEIESANLKLRETSIKDSLTGCFNKKYFQETIDLEISRGKRYSRPISLIIFDVDYFKKINDEHGHPFGDEVLREIGEIMRRSIRSSDAVFRYGGDEFSIVLPETKKDKAIILADRVRRRIAEHTFHFKNKSIHVTVSGGVNGFDSRCAEKEDLITHADKACYLAKKRGRNQIAVYSP